MSGRLENDSFKLLELKLNLEGNMADKIQNAYETSKNIYDDVLTQRNIFSKLYIKLFWSGTDDNDIARKVLSYVPDDFSGNLLDVPVGTAVFTENKWSSLKNAHITCIDYSMDMLEQARKRLGSHAHIKCIQGDVGNLGKIETDRLAGKKYSCKERVVFSTVSDGERAERYPSKTI